MFMVVDRVRLNGLAHLYVLSHIIKALLDKCEVKLNVTSPHVSDLAGSHAFLPDGTGNEANNK